MVPPVVSSAALPVTAPAKPSVPAQDAYAVKEEPIHTVATADPVHVLPATASAKPSVPAQDAYAVKEEPIHTSATADPVHVLPATASAKPSVPAQDAYAVKKAPVISTSAVDPVHTQPAVAPAKPSVPAQDAYAVEKSPLISASAVDAVQAAPSDAPHAAIKAEGAEGSECDQQCEVKCQTTNIAFDVTQCRSSCLAECRGEGKSSAHGTADRYVPATHGKAAHGLSLDHESVSYEECIESCKGNWQTAGIAFDVSQGEYDCASACARYSAEDTKVILKKKTVPTVSPFRIPPPAPPVELSSETVSYDSCMRECKGKWQTGDIFVSQGEYDCASDCAQYASDDKKIVVKKATPLSPLPASSFRLPPPAPPVEFSSETVSYESCMQKCKGKWQTGDIFVSQGKYDCASDCAQYASDDKKIVVKKAMPPSPLPASSFRLPVPKPHVKIASSEVTYESCMSKCKGKWQTGDIFVSQGKYDCESGCAEYASDDKKIVVKKATPPSPLPASSFRLPVPKPDVKIASSEVNFESCMRSCKGRWQTAGIGFDVSQGDYDCKSHCAKYAAEDDEVIIRKDTLPLPAHEDEFPSAPAARVFHKGSIAWEACSK
ncbi:hypothetical protein F5B18DRAFT_628210 [Nemania serpens]|nr:hypothetical protein F5B18DRAFT_628210 [Nemania serpens]